MGESSGTGVASPANLVLVPLHHRLDLTESCAELLNQTWRRSLGARMHSLQRSSDKFPVCLVLIGAPAGPALGHARLCRVVGLQDSLFVESVVVGVELRGKGYGRKLMDATERYAKGRGFRNLYLTTHDKQDFYYHLGYRLSNPVQNMGNLGSLLPEGMFQNMAVSKANQHPTPSSTPLSPPPSSSPMSGPPLSVHTDQSASLPQCCPPLFCSTFPYQSAPAPSLFGSTSQPPPAPRPPQPLPAPPLLGSTSQPPPAPRPPQPLPAPPLLGSTSQPPPAPRPQPLPAPPLLGSTSQPPPAPRPPQPLPAPPLLGSTSQPPPAPRPQPLPAPPLLGSTSQPPPAPRPPQPLPAPPLLGSTSQLPPTPPLLGSTSQPPLSPPPSLLWSTPPRPPPAPPLLGSTPPHPSLAPPQPPSAPPPHLQSTDQKRTGSCLQTPYCDFRGEPVFWMKKCI